MPNQYRSEVLSLAAWGISVSSPETKSCGREVERRREKSPTDLGKG